MSILAEIFAHKRLELEQARRLRPLPALQEAAAAAAPTRSLSGAISAAGPVRLIAEVKCASPSKGLLSADFDPLRLARAYAANGAAAISVLTDERYFKGSLEHLRQVRALGLRTPSGAELPLLRKDFICDPYQVFEARAAGADAILLIAAALPPAQMADLFDLAGSLGLECLVEVHNLAELQAALQALEGRRPLLGINNRDLHTFAVSLETCAALRPHVPAGLSVVAESGIHTPADMQRLAQMNVQAALVGEALVSAADTAAAVRALAGLRLPTEAPR